MSTLMELVESYGDGRQAITPTLSPSGRDGARATADATLAEIGQRLDYLRTFGDNADEDCRGGDCWRKAIAHVLDGADPW